MNNTIQHYYFNDTSSYGKSARLNVSIDELNSRQPKDGKDSVTVISKDDAATVEISELARAMYGTSYEGLTGAEREQRELEDYIASHSADTSIDLLRNGSLLQQAGAARQVDEALLAAEREYTEAFAGAAENFADFSMKITYGAYSSNDVSVHDLNFEALDQMEELYQSFKEKIESDYEGDEKTKYLNKLNETYDAVFEEKIINPIKGTYDDKLVFFRPDSEETVKSIRAASTSKEALNEMVSGYMANQAVNRKQYTALLNGTRGFYDMAEDKSLWHDTAAVRSTLTDSMNAYASVKEVKAGSSSYLSAKSAADAIAKKISDQYAQNLEYREERLGFRKNGEDTPWSRIVGVDFDHMSSGMFLIDFSKITGWSSLLDSI